MKEYKKHEDKVTVVSESLGAYTAPSTGVSLVSHALMDELMAQSDEVKWYVINRLMESMKHKNGLKITGNQDSTDESKSYVTVAGWKQEAEAARDYYRKKYNLPDSLIRLIGCIPPLTDVEREKAKEDYLLGKYGRQ